MNDIINDVMKQKESIILDQLNELISRGLLVIEEGPMTLVTDEATAHKIRLKQTVSLKLKDQEYIETLEKENKELKEVINKLQSVLNE